MTVTARSWMGLIVCAVMALALFVAIPSAQANPKYSAMVMDMNTGKVLHSRHADKKLYPASLTKMMTLYMTFDALRSGKLHLDQKLPISRVAAGQPPSKIGLRRGKTITVRDAIQACATKSANDAAVVLAEAIGGSVKKFATLSTRKARAMGMKNTTFKNPHGLTKRGQLSTARDMAVLGRRLFLDFPEHYHVFARKKFRHSGRNFYATNKLLGRYKGADGIKTGYTNASGFNLVASAERDGRRVLGVVFGGKSSARRNRHMKRLLDDGFKKAEKFAGSVSASRIPDYFLESPTPRLSPRNGGTALAIAALTKKDNPSVVRRSLSALSDAIVSPAEAATRPGKSKKQHRKSLNGDWAVQIGAYRKRSLAERRLEDVEQLRRRAKLVSAAPRVSVRHIDGRPLYRARFEGMGRADADRACKRLLAKKVDCFVVIAN